MRSPRVAIAQVRPRKAAYGANLRHIGAVFGHVAGWERPPNILVFPEAATSGYFLEAGVRDVAVTTGTLVRDLEEEHRASGAPPLDVVVGFYEAFANHYHNSAVYASLGEGGAVVRHVHRKVFLPTYGVFDEQRFVQPSHGVRAFDTDWGRMAIVICEDAWHSIMPTLAALDGAQFIFVPSASPARGMVPAEVLGGAPDRQALPASLERWERLARTVAGEHGVYVAMAQLVGFEGGKGFPGASMLVGPDGDLLARGPLFEEAILVADCDYDELTRVRTTMPLLSDLAAEWPNLFGGADRAPAPVVGFGPPAPRSAPARKPDAGEFAVHAERSREDPLAIDADLVERWLVAFIRDELLFRRGFSTGIVGLSGGVDSSLTAYLAAKALGNEHVVGVRMPYRTSSAESFEHAQLVADALGIELVTVDISAAVDGYAGAVDETPDPTRLGNVMARVRMITLFDLSAARRGLPLGTGNKTERLLGYFTWHADDSPPVNPLGDLFKTQVWALARHVGVPEAIVRKPATADLIQGQTDEGDLGIPYGKADMILHWLLWGMKPAEIEAKGFTAEEIRLVDGRLNATHWKRRQPTVAMMSQTAIGEYYLRPVDY